jgi:hypothetical protein
VSGAALPRPINIFHRSWFQAAAVLWLAGVSTGLWVLWAFDNAPGRSANAPARWPSNTPLVRASGQPTIVLLVHPQCSCTRATLSELAEALGRARTRPKTYVLFLKPEGFSAGWAQTDLWRMAASLPGVTVLRDDDGLEAKRFGAFTSGQLLLYDSDGTLLFNGGITGARAQAGANAGRSAIVDLLNRGQSTRAATNVFGCPLFASGL